MNGVNYRGVEIPRTQMGAVSSDDLFEPREQVIFDFYERSRNRYRRALDIGANLGVHTILMARQGWHVKAFEPDPVHYKQLLGNVLRNDTAPGACEAINKAVSNRSGTGQFVRVLGNTTANHLEGSRGHHGPVERFEVELADCRALFDWADFAKIDCEGHEAVLVRSLTRAQRCELMVEVGTPENAAAIFLHCNGIKRAMYSQKAGWERVHYFSQIPWSYREGSLFIGEAWQ